MALQSVRSGRIVQLLGVALAFAMVASVGLALLPAARAAFTGPGVALAPGKYTGTNVYVPGETIQITITATPGDLVNLLIEDAAAVHVTTINNLTIGSSGQRIVTYTLPMSWPDGFGYRVQGTDTSAGNQVRFAFFGIFTYNVGLWTDRSAYLPGDTVTVSWSVTYIQNGSLAPNGIGVLEAYDVAGNALFTPQYNFSASQSSYAFAIAPTEATGQRPWVYFWFNDTAGLRMYTATRRFFVNPLGIILQLSAASYAPGGVVTANIYTRVSPNPANPNLFDPAAPGVPVSVNVTDLGTGNVVPGYSATGLVTDASGYLSYVFQLTSTPTTGNYEVDATATAHGTLSASTSATFAVRPVAALSVQISLDKLAYASGDTVHATAQKFPSTANVSYTWQVRDLATNAVLANAAGAQSTYGYPIPTSYEGTLVVTVTINDGNGSTATASTDASVSFGYLALSLDRSEFNPGDTITATFSLTSNVITNPTYFWQVRDANGQTQAAGSTTGTTIQYATPNPASRSYTFTVTASQNGRTVEASQTANQVAGYFLSVSVDRASYNPGDTITISYTITPRGSPPAPLPSVYRFVIYIFGMPSRTVDTTSASGTLTYPVPSGAPQGDQILEVFEGNTGAAWAGVVHIGAVNPLLVDVAGVPLFDILIFLLFVVLLLAVILLWRRTGMGRAPPSEPTGKPSTPPPPPPSGPGQQAAGPMSVACKHCGASIEITTSKRPIEVMCPSCGETQVVQ